ncbi:hypothetical protein BJ170DRAFT_605229, partial [Xylariales sp. AK1849]
MATDSYLHSPFVLPAFALTQALFDLDWDSVEWIETVSPDLILQLADSPCVHLAFRHFASECLRRDQDPGFSAYTFQDSREAVSLFLAHEKWSSDWLHGRSPAELSEGGARMPHLVAAFMLRINAFIKQGMPGLEREIGGHQTERLSIILGIWGVCTRVCEQELRYRSSPHPERYAFPGRLANAAAYASALRTWRSRYVNILDNWDNDSAALETAMSIDLELRPLVNDSVWLGLFLDDQELHEYVRPVPLLDELQDVKYLATFHFREWGF